jgi:ATP-dependent Clp protease ATP-binding subunit ClpA
MKKIPKPKFEKVDDNTIRIIVEKIQNVPLSQIIDNREKLLKQKKQMKEDVETQEKIIDQTIKNIDEVLAEAKRLGIVAKPIKPIPPAIRQMKEGSEGKKE